MTKPHSFSSAFLVLVKLVGRVVALCLAVCCFAYTQEYYPNQEVRINDLPSLTSKSRDASDVLAASVEIILRDKEICCAKNSALEDSVQSADPKSLKDIAAKLQGRHLLSDGRPIMVTAEYVPATSLVAGTLIGTLSEKQPLLMEWNSHLYVVSGLIYSTTYTPEGERIDSILKIFLLDPRFSGQRREVTFDRSTDDWGKVQGLLTLKAAVQ
ncbi:MAG: hypothetical protein WCA20_09100 [Candidatus Sulfotelmatobacter sp.]